jgi:hypothetical protein
MPSKSWATASKIETTLEGGLSSLWQIVCSSQDDRNVGHTKNESMGPLRHCYSDRLSERIWGHILSSAVKTPFTRMGSLVIVCSHLTSCTHHIIRNEIWLIQTGQAYKMSKHYHTQKTESHLLCSLTSILIPLARSKKVLHVRLNILLLECNKAALLNSIYYWGNESSLAYSYLPTEGPINLASHIWSQTWIACLCTRNRNSVRRIRHWVLGKMIS